MANGLFNLKQVMQGIQQGGWNGGVNTTYAASFNGSTQYLNVSSSTIASTGQFCIEAWVFQTGRSVSSSQGIFSQYSAGVAGRFYFRFNADKLSFSTSAGDNVSTSSVYVNTWYHVAVTRDASNVLRLFINGVLDYNATVSQSLLVANAQIAAIANVENWQGYISNLRTVSGAIPTAYQTSSTTNGTVVFKPAIEPLSTTSQGASGTSLLTLQNATIVDNSTNGYTFTNTGTVTTAINSGVFGAVAKTPAVEYLVVAGGGNGGLAGGGAGGLLTGIVSVPNQQTLLVTVGAGGSSTNGSNSVFGNITSIGGAGSNSGVSGGSGCGAYFNAPLNASQGVSGQGNAGAAGNVNGGSGGGGGGAGTVGFVGPAINVGGNGGAGIASAISGTVTPYAGGGGGYGSSTGAPGGVGGGGTGSTAGANGSAGTANTGGGGGSSTGGGAYSGGSGIVIISYPDVYAAPIATTGSPTVSTSGSGSIYFPDAGGSGGASAPGYIRYAGTSALAIGTTGTYEFWIYPTRFSVNHRVIDQSAISGIEIYYDTSGNLFVGLTSGGANVSVSASPLSLNTWTHVAVVFNSGTITIYFNGTGQTLTGTTVGYNMTSTATVSISGYQGIPGQYGVIGYLANVRIVKGVAVYTGNFTSPTTPLQATQPAGTNISAITGTSTSLLLNGVSGAFLADSSTNSYTASSVSTSTAAPTWNQLSPFTGTGYKNRVYTWTSSGSITF